MKKILVTGSNGFLGMKLREKTGVKTGLSLIATGKGPDRYPQPGPHSYVQMDITDAQNVRDVIARHRPDTIIHSAAISHVDVCERDPELCHAINVEATRNLAETAAAHNAHFIFLSTDFVFDGTNGPYQESDPLHPLNRYGASKAEAEKIVGENSSSAIVRTILVYGAPLDAARGNIITWALKELRAGRPIKVADDHWRMPTFVDDLADGCLEIAARKAAGIFHLSGPEGLSVYDFVCRAARFWKLDEHLIEPVPASFFGGQAVRPPRTGFVPGKAQRDLDYQPLGIEESFSRMAGQ